MAAEQTPGGGLGCAHLRVAPDAGAKNPSAAAQATIASGSPPAASPYRAACARPPEPPEPPGWAGSASRRGRRTRRGGVVLRG